MAKEAQTLSAGTMHRLGLREVSGVVPGPDEALKQDPLAAAREAKFLEDARERFKVSVMAESPRRDAMLDDLKFKCGFQWRDTDTAIRMQQGRPCLTINRIPGFLSHVVNNMRQARPEIKIDPVADGADEEIAEVRQGLIRHIELNSRAEIAYDTAFENLCTMGLGYTRIVDAWSDIKSTDKDLFIEWVPNTFSVYEDPAARKPDWSDGKYRFIVEDVSMEEFRRRFGREKTPVSLSEFRSIGDNQPYWILGNKIRIAEYFHVEEEDDILYELEDGTTEFESALTDLQMNQVILLDDGSPDPNFFSKRKNPTVYWTLMYGLGILRQRKWPGKYIPVIPFIGNQTELEGEMILVGMVRYAKEAQRMFNYMYSSFVETCALAPRSPFVAEFSQIQEFEATWATANTNPTAYLPYRAKTVEGVIIPPPRREQAEPAIQAFVEGLKLADDNLKSIFRIFDASLGQRGPQESGLAINSRKVESDLATYDWVDNFGRGLRTLGLALNDLLQYYYNSKGRIVQILQEDLSTKPVVMNQMHKNNEGKDTLYDLSKGRFAISISTGPGFATKRQEFVKSAVEVAKYYPQLWQICGPDIIRGMDWPNKDGIAAQMEKAMPPELRKQDPNEQQDSPEQLKATLNQAMQQIQLLSKALTEASEKNSADYQKELFETFRTQMVQETQLAIAQLKTGTQEAQYLNDKIFTELEQIRAAIQPQLNGQGQPTSDSGKTAAPGAPQPSAPQPSAPSSAPPGAGATPAVVSNSNPTP